MHARVSRTFTASRAEPNASIHRRRNEMKYAALFLIAAILVLPRPVHSAKDHADAALATVGASGVAGDVHLVQLPHGGANLHVSVHGLQPGETYTSFYYESADCSAPADAFQTFTANARGAAELQGKIDDDVDEVGSVSVRLGSGYGTLLACADLEQ
jgi:hypothetical protein